MLLFLFSDTLCGSNTLMRRSIFLIFILTILLSTTVIAAQENPTRTEEGTISNATPYIIYDLEIEQDGTLIILDIVPKDAESGLDTLLYLVDSNNNIIAENDDRPGAAPGDFSSRIEFPQASAGHYHVVATRYNVLDGTSEGDFILTIETSLPDETNNVQYDTSPEALAAAGFPIYDTPHPRSTWTVLAYYGADTNLEGAIINDFKEFERAGGSTDSVRVLVLMDRSPEYSTASGNWFGARLFEVTADTSGVTIEAGDYDAIELSTVPLADLGESVDSGDGSLLAKFLVWGVQNYPADHYVVAMGSHGAAWRGIITDNTANNSIISLPELHEAFSVATQTAGVDKFTLLINDACLMSSVEYHSAVSPFFNYSLASPEIVVDPALDMTLFTESIRSEDVTLPILGASLVDTYVNRDIQLRPGPDTVFLTYAVTDLNRFPSVESAIEDFADFFLTDPIKYGAILGRARANTYVYSGFLNNDNLVDLGNLMEQVIDLADPLEDTELITRAHAVLDALDAAVDYGNGGAVVTRQTYTYHNIYFPAHSRNFNPDYFEEGYLGDWAAMLRAYYNTLTPKQWTLGEITFSFHQPIAPAVNITSVYPVTDVSIYTGIEVQVEIVGRNISGIEAIVDQIQPDGRRIRMVNKDVLVVRGSGDNIERVNDWDDGVNVPTSTTTLTWDVALPVVTDGTNTYFELLNIGEEVATLDGRYREPGSEQWNTVSLVFDRETGTLQRVVNQAESNNAVAVVNIPPGSDFESFRYIVTPDGRVSVQPGNQYVWHEGGLSWHEQPAPTGEYEVGFVVSAFGGTQGFASVSFSIHNDNADPNYRAGIRTRQGFSLVYPVEWEPLAFFPNENWFRTSNSNNTENFTLYPGFGVTENDPHQVIEAVLNAFDMRLITGTEIREITVDGFPALEFDYRYDRGEGTYIGRGFAVFRENSIPQGLVFGAETSTNASRLSEIYTILQENITLFDPGPILQANTGQWVLLNPNNSPVPYTIFPVLRSWAPGDGLSDDFFFIRPSDDQQNNTFFAIGVLPSFSSQQAGVEAVLSDYVSGTLENYRLLDNRLFSGKYQNWYTGIYTGTRDTTPVIGRVYVTLDSQRSYVLWMEAPNTDTGTQTYANVLEPMVDRFEIVPIPLEQLGVIPHEVNQGPTSIAAATDDEPALLMRYDGRTFAVYNRLPNTNIDISDLSFVQNAGTEAEIRFNATQWTAGGTDSVRPADCYQVWKPDYTELVRNDYPTDICNWRQGFGPTQHTFWLSTEAGTTFQVYRGEELLATCLAVRPVDSIDFVERGERGTEMSCLADLTPGE